MSSIGRTDYFTNSRTSGAHHSLQLQATDYIRIYTAAIDINLSVIQDVDSSRYDDAANFHLNYLVLLLEINNLCLSEFFTDFAFACGKVDTFFTVYYWNIGDGLGEGNVNRCS